MIWWQSCPIEKRRANRGTGAPETGVCLRGVGTVRRVHPIPPGRVKEGFPVQMAFELCFKERFPIPLLPLPLRALKQLVCGPQTCGQDRWQQGALAGRGGQAKIENKGEWRERREEESRGNGKGSRGRREGKEERGGREDKERMRRERGRGI